MLTVDVLANDYPELLLGPHHPPCLSLYQPTHRLHPDNQQDPIRFRNLIKAMEQLLRQKYPDHEHEPLLAPYRALAEDKAFWNNTFDGLAVLGTSGLFRVYRLQRTPAELVTVGDGFHTKPLVRFQQSADRYQILGLNRREIRLFEGNRDHLDEIDPAPGVPRSVDQVSDAETEQDRSIRTHGPIKPAMGRHGAGDAKHSATDAATEHFFRAVDRAVLEHHSRPGEMPLLLAALPEHHHLFRTISRNPYLAAEAMDVNPDALSLDALRERAWQLLLPHYLERLSGLIDAFGAAGAKGQSTDDLAEAAKAAVAGRIATLLLEADRHVPGRMDQDTGAITLETREHPELDDLLDDVGEHVLKNGGEVIVVPAERMPTKTGCAAIYRF
jgi:hypothetical protein